MKVVTDLVMRVALEILKMHLPRSLVSSSYCNQQLLLQLRAETRYVFSHVRCVTGVLQCSPTYLAQGVTLVQVHLTFYFMKSKMPSDASF